MLPNEAQGEHGPLLIMLHWLGGGAQTWREVGHGLASRGVHFVALDLPGFGMAANLSATDVQSAADAVAATVRSLRTYAGATPWLLGGHSMGGKIAAVVARRALNGEAGLEGLRGLILTSPSPPSPEPIQETRRAEQLKTFGEPHDNPNERREAAGRWVDGNTGKMPLPDAIRERAINGLLAIPPASFRAWFLEGSKEDWSSRVGTLPLPALLFTGTEETSLGADTQRALTLPQLPEAQLVVLDGAKHLTPLERPGEMVEHITQFLSGLGLTLAVLRQSPDVAFRALLDSAHTSPQTREAMSSRMQHAQSWNAIPQVFTPAEFRTLRALAQCVVPDAGFDLAAALDAQLASDKGDGWRYGLLPPDSEAWRRGLLSLDLAARRAYSLPFLSLYPDQQHALLQEAAAGTGGYPSEPRLEEGFTASLMQQWFEDVRGEFTRLYIADPRTMDRVGYTGFADDLGFTQIELGQVEAFER